MASDKKLNRIISPEGLREAQSELAFFARKILGDIKMTGPRWEYYLQTYLEKSAKHVPKNPKDRSYARGNLNTQFMSNNMTWRTFIEFLMFLSPRKIRFTLELEWPNRTVTKHSMNVRTRQMSEEMLTADGIDGGDWPSGTPTASEEDADGDAADLLVNKP